MPNKEKFEVLVGIGVKKGIKVALCGMKNFDFIESLEDEKFNP